MIDRPGLHWHRQRAGRNGQLDSGGSCFVARRCEDAHLMECEGAEKPQSFKKRNRTEKPQSFKKRNSALPAQASESRPRRAHDRAIRREPRWLSRPRALFPNAGFDGFAAGCSGDVLIAASRKTGGGDTAATAGRRSQIAATVGSGAVWHNLFRPEDSRLEDGENRAGGANFRPHVSARP